jgi:hypothetical protein
MTFNYGYDIQDTNNFTTYINTIVSFKDYLDKLIVELSKDNFDLNKLKVVHNLINRFKSDVNQIENYDNLVNDSNDSNDLLDYNFTNVNNNYSTNNFICLDDNSDNESNNSECSVNTVNSNCSVKTDNSDDSECSNNNPIVIGNKKTIDYHVNKRLVDFVENKFDCSKVLSYRNNDLFQKRLDKYIKKSYVY